MKQWLESLKEAWKTLRPIIAIWSSLVWLILIGAPAYSEIRATGDFITYLPVAAIGLALCGGIYIAHKINSDGHFVWFAVVLMLIAGWM